ncbi:hypothetical protein ACG1BZ_04835 [Microbulbifer sp. CNSA002]|uniref:hypothetical protein n=1 Tax=Microbulbifer sp. CNSA002 TaxID=3373604 RepID=UPI0039B56102
MAEAWGTVVIKGDDSIVDLIKADDESIEWASMESLFLALGLGQLKDSHYKLEYCKGNSFYHEGIQRGNGIASISIFGDEWMPVVDVLAKNARGIEIYARIRDEYGTSAYYILTKEEQRFNSSLDYECGVEESEEAEFEKQWSSLVPSEIKATYFS